MQIRTLLVLLMHLYMQLVIIRAKAHKIKTRINATAITQASEINTSAKLLDGAGSGTGTNCTAAQLNNRLSNGHSIVASFTGTQSLGTADTIRVTNVVEQLASGTTAATQFAGVQDAIGNNCTCE